MNITDYQLGVLWSIGSYEKDRKRFVLRYREKYFLEQLQNITSTTGNIYLQVDAGKEQYVLYIYNFSIEYLYDMNWTERNADKRYLPPLNSYKDFLRSYIEIHSVLDYCTRYDNSKTKKNKYKALRLRIYGNKNILEGINVVLYKEAKVPPKTVQVLDNDKTAILYYTSLPQIESIFKYIEGTPCFDKYWDNVYEKLANPKIYLTSPRILPPL